MSKDDVHRAVVASAIEELRARARARTEAHAEFWRGEIERQDRIYKARRAALDTTARRIDTRARPFARALAAWLDRFAALAMAEELREQGLVTKRLPEVYSKLSEELRRLLLRFGIRTLTDAGSADPALGQRGDLIAQAIERKPTRIKWFWEWTGAVEARTEAIAEETRDAVRASVRQILVDGNAESPRPSAGELARRIRTQVAGGEGERLYVFSPERAAAIARTELVQAENTGIVAGYEASGVREVEWLAYRDGRSGDRHHEKMHGVRVRLGDSFRLPSGARLRYPGDPAGPIGETINCRCTTAPVRPLRPRTT